MLFIGSRTQGRIAWKPSNRFRLRPKSVRISQSVIVEVKDAVLFPES